VWGVWTADGAFSRAFERNARAVKLTKDLIVSLLADKLVHPQASWRGSYCARFVRHLEHQEKIPRESPKRRLDVYDFVREKKLERSENPRYEAEGCVATGGGDAGTGEWLHNRT